MSCSSEDYYLEKSATTYTFFYLKISGFFVSAMMAFYLLYYSRSQFFSFKLKRNNKRRMKGQKVKADGKGKKIMFIIFLSFFRAENVWER